MYPVVLVGTIKALMTRLPLSGMPVWANTSALSALDSVVTNCFVTFKTYGASFRSARVHSVDASDPAWGSVRQKAERCFHVARAVRNCSFCASVPNRRIGRHPTELCPLMIVDTAPHSTAISSNAVP